MKNKPNKRSSNNKKSIVNKVDQRNNFPFKNWVVYLLLFIATILLYGWTSNFDWGLDDLEFIYYPIQKIINNGNNFNAVFSESYGNYDYRPIVYLSFWLENIIFNGLNPSKCHIVNVLFFGVLIIQIYRFIIVSKFYNNKEKLQALALLTALLFLIHPVHVSVVANIKSRDNILSMLFGITSSIQFILFFKDNKWWRVILAVIILTVAMLSKQDAYAFIFVPISYYFLYKNKLNLKDFFTQRKYSLLILLSFLLLIIIPSTLFDIFSNNLIYQSNNQMIRNHLDSPLFYNDSFINRLSFFLTTLLYYFKFMLIPQGYYFYFGYNQIPLTVLWHPLNILSFSIYFSLFVVSVKFFKKDKIFLFAFLFFMLAIAYAANFSIIISGILMDRYAFIASLGFLIGLSALILKLTQINNWRILYNKFVLLLFLVLVSATVYRTSAWRNIETLFNRDIKHLTNSAQAHSMIGGYYINQGIFQDIPKVEQDNKVKLGESYIDKSLKITEFNKFALESKALCRIHFNDDIHAIPYLRKAIIVDSNYVGAYNHLGIAFRNLSEIDSALKYFNIGMQKDQLFSYPADNYIQMLIRKNQFNTIDSTLKILLHRFPNDYHLNQKINNWNNNKAW